MFVLYVIQYDRSQFNINCFSSSNCKPLHYDKLNITYHVPYYEIMS